MSEENVILKEVQDFLSVLRQIIDSSYTIENSLSPKEWLDDESEVVLIRGALFTLAKDAFQNITSIDVNRLIKFCIKNLPKYNNIKTFPEFIDNIVGGDDGKGYCLQSATSSLVELHNQIVEASQIGELYVINRENYKKTRDYVERKILKLEGIVNKEKSPLSSNKVEDILSTTSAESLSENHLTNKNEYPCKYSDYAFFNKNVHFKNDVHQNLVKDMVQIEADEQAKPVYLLSQAIINNDVKEVINLLEVYTVSELETPIEHGRFHHCLHIATVKGNEEIVKLLLEKGFNVNLKDRNSGMRTPLSFAAEKGHSNIIDLLISYSADTYVKDNFNRAPLDWENTHRAPRNEY